MCAVFVLGGIARSNWYCRRIPATLCRLLRSRPGSADCRFPPDRPRLHTQDHSRSRASPYNSNALEARHRTRLRLTPQFIGRNPVRGTIALPPRISGTRCSFRPRHSGGGCRKHPTICTDSAHSGHDRSTISTSSAGKFANTIPHRLRELSLPAVCTPPAPPARVACFRPKPAPL